VLNAALLHPKNPISLQNSLLKQRRSFASLTKANDSKVAVLWPRSNFQCDYFGVLARGVVTMGEVSRGGSIRAAVPPFIASWEGKWRNSAFRFTEVNNINGAKIPSCLKISGRMRGKAPKVWLSGLLLGPWLPEVRLTQGPSYLCGGLFHHFRINSLSRRPNSASRNRRRHQTVHRLSKTVQRPRYQQSSLLQNQVRKSSLKPPAIQRFDQKFQRKRL